MKIDVEGNELSVLLGSLNSIEKSKPTIFVELLRKWMAPFEAQPQDFVDVLQKRGYACLEIREDSLVPISEIDETTESTNFIFIHESQTAHLNSIREFISSQ
jgi:hypothetical protein